MGSFLDMFLPGASQYYTPDQQDGASNYGLLNAGLNLIDASDNHYGLTPSTLSILGQGVKGYGQGVQQYNQNIPAANTALAANSAAQLQQSQNALRQQLANAYLGKGSSAAVNSVLPTGNLPAPMGSNFAPQAPSFSPTQSQTGAIPPINASTLMAGAPLSMPTPVVPMNGSAQTADGGQMTAMGMTTKELAKYYFNQAGAVRAMGDDAGAKTLIEQATAIDPAINYDKAFQTSQGQLPAELTKIGATGNQARMTEGYKLRNTPTTQNVMVNGVMTEVPTSQFALANNMTPQAALAAAYQSANGGVPTVSTAVPTSAKAQSENIGKNMAEAQKASATLDSRMSNALSMIKQMHELADDTHQGYLGELRNAGERETGWGQVKNKAQEKFEQLNSNLFTQELPGIIQGAGGRLDIPLLNAIKQASAIDPYAPPATKKELLNSLQDVLVKAQQNAKNNVTNLSGQSGISAQPNITGQFNTPEQIGAAYQQGLINKELAVKLLQERHGMK